MKTKLRLMMILARSEHSLPYVCNGCVCVEQSYLFDSPMCSTVLCLEQSPLWVQYAPSNPSISSAVQSSQQLSSPYVSAILRASLPMLPFFLSIYPAISTFPVISSILKNANQINTQQHFLETLRRGLSALRFAVGRNQLSGRELSACLRRSRVLQTIVYSDFPFMLFISNILFFISKFFASIPCRCYYRSLTCVYSVSSIPLWISILSFSSSRSPKLSFLLALTALLICSMKAVLWRAMKLLKLFSWVVTLMLFLPYSSITFLRLFSSWRKPPSESSSMPVLKQVSESCYRIFSLNLVASSLLLLQSYDYLIELKEVREFMTCCSMSLQKLLSIGPLFAGKFEEKQVRCFLTDKKNILLFASMALLSSSSSVGIVCRCRCYRYSATVSFQKFKNALRTVSQGVAFDGFRRRLMRQRLSWEVIELLQCQLCFKLDWMASTIFSPNRLPRSLSGRTISFSKMKS